jgi:hypothetical protein
VLDRERTGAGVLVEFAGASDDVSRDDKRPVEHLGVEQ